VSTERGWLMLASDASHYYANMEDGNPFPIVENVTDMLEGHHRLRKLADSDDHIVPGHDPEVMRRYPAPSRETEGIVVSLHEPPRS
jgi:glyoxylase-like metal-dependent hydrolase (beta-lactamase superfamily II)